MQFIPPKNAQFQASRVEDPLKRNQALLRKRFYNFDSNRPVCVPIYLQFLKDIYQLGRVTNFSQASYLENNKLNGFFIADKRKGKIKERLSPMEHSFYLLFFQ